MRGPGANLLSARSSGEPSALLRFIEDMKAAAIEDEAEWITGRGGDEKIQCCEAAIEIAPVQLCDGSFDRERSDIDSQDVEASLGEPKGIRPRTRANLQRLGWRNATRSDEIDQQRLRLASVPGNLSRGVALIPGRVRHNPISLAPNRTGS